MTSDFRNIEFHNIKSQTAPAIHPGEPGGRQGELAFSREDHFNMNALHRDSIHRDSIHRDSIHRDSIHRDSMQHRDSKLGNIRENDFASRIQSLMSGDVALGNLQVDHGAGPSSTTLMGSSPGGGGMVPNGNGGVGVMPPGMQQADAQHDQNSRAPSRYEAQKRRDWNTFGQYLRNHRPPLALTRCTGVHVLEFVRYLDQFGKTKVHTPSCPFFGLPHPPHPCPCPLRQAWGSLDALIGRLRAAFEENGGKPESNPFGARQVRLYLREVREMQAKARGIAYEKKKRKRMPAASEGGANGASTGMSVSNGSGGLSPGHVHALPAQQ